MKQALQLQTQKQTFQDIFESWVKDGGEEFSGVFSASSPEGVIFQKACGYRNKAEKLPITTDTAFGIASGTKLFTGLAICKLVDEKKLSLEDKICSLLPHDLGQINKEVTVFHLLTHSSGVGDYIDEEADIDDALQSLYDKYPVQLWTKLEYYLQMITPLSAKFEPGHRYGYSNSGFVLLGLVVEAISSQSFQQYVQENIIASCGLTNTAFYRMDSLPANTALGYIQDDDTGKWHTNIYSLPIIGGSDGGLYTCAADLDKLWRAIFAHKLLSKEMTLAFLDAQITIDEECGESYGLGVYRNIEEGRLSYYVVGGDAGVDFFTGYFPETKIAVSAFANTNVNTFPLLNEAFEILG